MDYFNKFVLGMALLRIISGCIELSASVLMLKLNNVEKALLLNASLAIVGPLILIISTSIGLIGLSDKLSFSKIFFIFAGLLLIIIGIRK